MSGSPEIQKMHYDIPRQSLPTDIIIGKDILSMVPDLIDLSRYNSFTIISEGYMQDMYSAELRKGLTPLGKPIDMPTPLSSELNKTEEEADRILGDLLEKDPPIDSHALVFAVGGGIIGDLTGYTTGRFYRGRLDYVQIPTTLLAMVDSSVGGKAAVDYKGRTNVIGLVHLPIATVMDVRVLRTLSPRQVISGLAELVKHSLLDPALNEFLSEKNIHNIGKDDVLIKALTISTAYKMSIVEKDYEETKGIRTEVHFGHTIGRALETATYLTKFTHGEAVSIGMAAALKISNREGYLSTQKMEEILNTMRKFNLPMETDNIDRTKLWQAIRADKKSIGGIPRFVLLEGVGKPKVGCKVDEQIVNKVLDEIIH